VLFRVSAEWLLTGKHLVRPNFVPVLAYIGAGAEVHTVNDYEPGAASEYVEPPPSDGSNLVAARIKGDSMYPMQDGWIVFWKATTEGVDQACLGKLCAVQIVDGPCLVKIVRPGTQPGLYNLESWNAPPRLNAALLWASPIADIRPS
jgi:hypothetical protein